MEICDSVAYVPSATPYSANKRKEGEMGSASCSLAVYMTRDQPASVVDLHAKALKQPQPQEESGESVNSKNRPNMATYTLVHIHLNQIIFL
jgi:hypothetical protein